MCDGHSSTFTLLFLNHAGMIKISVLLKKKSAKDILEVLLQYFLITVLPYSMMQYTVLYGVKVEVLCVPTHPDAVYWCCQGCVQKVRAVCAGPVSS